MSRIGAALVGAAMLLPACTHYNTLYNAERVYRDAEHARQEGQDSLARAQYLDVVRRTSDAYRARPDGDQATATLFLLGRAHLRAGDARASAAALEEAALRATEPGLRPQVLVYLAVARERLGDVAGALARVDEAIAAGVSGEALAEARLLRGSIDLSRKPGNGAWNDLLAASAEPGVLVDAGLERLRLAVQHGEQDRAREAFSTLLLERAASVRLDTVVALVRAAADAWGAGTAAWLFAAADSTRWDQPSRGRARLEHARLLDAAGDTTGARARATRVASGRGEAAAEARLLLASWRLGSARDLGTATSARGLLLPASTDMRVDSVLRALDELERYAGLGLDRPLGWFAAAEVARDRLGAPVLARGFFLAYADLDPSDPWAPKALLGALDVSSDPPDRDWLRGRLEAHVGSPYVLAARGGAPAELEALEEELRVRLQEITGR